MAEAVASAFARRRTSASIPGQARARDRRRADDRSHLSPARCNAVAGLRRSGGIVLARRRRPARRTVLDRSTPGSRTRSVRSPRPVPRSARRGSLRWPPICRGSKANVLAASSRRVAIGRRSGRARARWKARAARGALRAFGDPPRSLRAAARRQRFDASTCSSASRCVASRSKVVTLPTSTAPKTCARKHCNETGAFDRRVRARKTGHRRRRELAGASVRRGRPLAGLHEERVRRDALRPRRPRLPRLRHVVGSAAARARPPRRGPGCRQRRGARHVVRHADRSRERTRRADRRDDAVDRAVAIRLERHRSDDERDSARAGFHGPREDREVCRVLSRSRRFVSHRRRLRRANARRSRFARRHRRRRPPTRSCCRSTIATPSSVPSRRAPRRSPR